MWLVIVMVHHLGLVSEAVDDLMRHVVEPMHHVYGEIGVLVDVLSVVPLQYEIQWLVMRIILEHVQLMGK